MDQMDPSTAQHHQTLENMLVCTKPQQEKKPRPGDEHALKCPRCESTNTKFCYYNNYSLTQPRYFCKSCRRYWTKGGTLRNIPVGGGCRKNKRSSPSSSSSSPSKKGQDQPLITINHNHPFSNFSPLPYDPTDLSLAFARLQGQTNGHLGFDGHHPHVSMLGNPSNTQYCNIASSGHGFLETQNGFHSVYYGVGNGDQNGGMGANFGDDQMGILAYEDNGATTVKQECFNGGYPWQLGGDGNLGGDHVDSGRQYSWNGVGSSWHGLLNSPLM